MPLTPLALHHFTLGDVSPLELVPIAAEVGCAGVCLFVESPPGFGFPLVTPAMRGELIARLREHGVRVIAVDLKGVALCLKFKLAQMIRQGAMVRSSMAVPSALSGRTRTTVPMWRPSTVSSA